MTSINSKKRNYSYVVHQSYLTISLVNYELSGSRKRNKKSKREKDGKK